MTKKLHIAADFSLPLEAVTQTFAILAKRGAGKTYTAAVMAEEMLTAHQPIVALDPTGAWWGLRSGFPIAVFGGEYGDIPLEETAGEVIAAAIVENRFSAVLDLSLFRKGQMIRFMVSFAETLYRLNRDPVHLFVDEADAFAPQGRTYGGEENRMLGAMEDIVRRGRKRGIGCTLITQRPAVLNKNVLTQCESLFALRLVHPKDIDAVMEWVNVHADSVQSKEMIGSLPQLQIGEAWFWSPGWFQVLQRIKVRKRETFDSSATPKPGETIKAPKTLAEINLDALGERIKATVAKVKENDPKELKRRIAELEKQAREKAVPTKLQVERMEIPVLKNGQLDKANYLVERLEKIMGKVGEVTTGLTQAIGRMAKQNPNIPPPAYVAPTVRVSAIKTRKAEDGSSNGRLPIGERRILSALIQYPSGLTREQLTVLAGYKRSSRDAYIQRLREKGYCETGDKITATAEGTSAIPDAEPLPTGENLREYWLNKLPMGEKAILEMLIAAYPESVDREKLSEATGYQRSSRDAYLQRLGAKELIETPNRGEVRATENLF